MKPKGMYVPLDVGTQRNRKIREARAAVGSNDPELLYIRALMHVKKERSEGFLDEFDLPSVAAGMDSPEAVAAALVDAELWAVEPGGWVVTGWLEWNPSNEEIAALNANRRRAATLSHHRRGLHVVPDQSCADCQVNASARANDSANDDASARAKRVLSRSRSRSRS